MNKEFVLVCQGIEILRTKNQDEIVRIVNENNKYLNESYENYIFIEIEYHDKEKYEEKITKAIDYIEKLRQSFSDDLQADFINIINILNVGYFK